MTRMIFVFTFLSCLATAVVSKCYTEIHITGISFFHDDRRPLRVELFDLPDENKFKDYDACQANLVYKQMKNGGEIIKDPKTGRIVLKSKIDGSDWLKEIWSMCSYGGKTICE